MDVLHALLWLMGALVLLAISWWINMDSTPVPIDKTHQRPSMPKPRLSILGWFAFLFMALNIIKDAVSMSSYEWGRFLARDDAIDCATIEDGAVREECEEERREDERRVNGGYTGKQAVYRLLSGNYNWFQRPAYGWGTSESFDWTTIRDLLPLPLSQNRRSGGTAETPAVVVPHWHREIAAYAVALDVPGREAALPVAHTIEGSDDAIDLEEEERSDGPTATPSPSPGSTLSPQDEARDLVLEPYRAYRAVERDTPGRGCISGSALESGDTRTWRACRNCKFNQGPPCVGSGGNYFRGRDVYDVARDRGDVLPIEDPSVDFTSLSSLRTMATQMAASIYVQSKREKLWWGRYRDLLNYRIRNGSFRLESGKSGCSGELQNWAEKQRGARRKKNGEREFVGPSTVLQDWHEALLDAVDYNWNPNPGASPSLARANEVKVFAEKHGHPFVPHPKSTLDQSLKDLSCWLRKLRARKKAGQSIDDKVVRVLEKLMPVGFVWEPTSHSRDHLRIEYHVLEDLQTRAGIEFDFYNQMLSEQYTLKPDAMKVQNARVNGKNYNFLTVFEVDEHRHSPGHPQYTVAREQARQTKLHLWAQEKGFDGLHLVRMNVAERYRIHERQQKLLVQILQGIENGRYQNPESAFGNHITMIDYPKNHPHARANVWRTTVARPGKALPSVGDEANLETPLWTTEVDFKDSGAEKGW